MFTRAFWKATAERSVSTGAQATVLAWGGGMLPDVSLPWWTIPVAFAGGAGLTLFKCLAAVGYNGGGPSATNVERLS